MKRYAGLAVILLALGGIAWWLLRPGEAVAPGIRAWGTVEATEADLGFQRPGRIEAIQVREGDRVQEGALLAWLDRREMEAERAVLEAAVGQVRARLEELERGPRPQEVARAEAAVRSATETLEERRRDAERARILFEGGAISREALERAETGLGLAEAALDGALEALSVTREGPRLEQVAAQRASVRQAEAALLRAEVALEGAEIRAPFEGIVALRHRERGETVGVGVPVLTLRDLEDRWVRIYVAGDKVGRIHLDQRAEIRGDARPERSHAGEVFFIGSEAEFTPRNVQTAEERVRLVYPVRVRILEDPDGELKPGLPVDVVLSEDGAPPPSGSR